MIKNLTEILNTYKSDKGDTYLCAHGYSYIYQNLFKTLRVNSILEIGLNREGGTEYPSLKAWREYLPEAKIYGFDINDFKSDDPNIIIFRGDQSDPNFLNALLNEVGKVDVLIDDGSHASQHQQVSLAYLFDLVSSGGLYIIEDLHYQPNFEDNSIIKTRELLENFVSNKICSNSAMTQLQQEHILNNIDYIEFYPSLRYGKNCLAVLKKK